MANGIRTVEHGNREDTLKAAKRAVRNYPNARLNHIVSSGEDTIEILRGGEVLERHFCIVAIKEKKPFDVEELALYR